jgi:hypothetical protein
VKPASHAVTVRDEAVSVSRSGSAVAGVSTATAPSVSVLVSVAQPVSAGAVTRASGYPGAALSASDSPVDAVASEYW